MSDITPRPNRTPSRRSREDRAYKLVLAGSAAAVISSSRSSSRSSSPRRFGIPILAALVAVLCGWMFRRTVA